MTRMRTIVLLAVALAAAWGGPAAARLIITSKDVKDRSLRGKDLRSNTVTGRVVAGLSGRDIKSDSLTGYNIDERSLDSVRRADAAGRADSAARADVADTLAGARVLRVAFSAPADTAASTVLDAAGLRLQARCANNSVTSVIAMSTAPGGFIRVTGTHPDSQARGGAAAVYAEDDDLQPGDQFNVLAVGSDDATGTLSWYGPDGTVLTLPFLVESGLTGRPMACLFAGTATVSQAG